MASRSEKLKDLLRSGSERDVSHRTLRGRPGDLLHFGSTFLQRDPDRSQRSRGDALSLMDQAQQHMLGADIVVPEQASLLLR